jgi:Tol biopolymer transport system component/DNA-binding winged helix-turn-helix (wHTH) protein
MNGTANLHPNNGSEAAPFRVGGWYVEPALKVISRGGKRVQVEPRIMHVLIFLAGRAGEVVSRGELLEAVWGDVVVNEEALTHAVSQLRRVFGDDAKTPSFIQTIHKTGYRLIAPVALEAAGTPGDRPGRAAAKRLYAVAGAAGVIIAVIASLAIMSRTRSSVSPPPVALEALPFTAYPGNEECPALSPDGGRVAFSYMAEGADNYDLFVKQSNTEKPMRLTETDGHEFYATWSPDAADMAYALFDAGGAAIYVMPAIGGPARKLIDLPFGVAGIDWSPDGRYLAYASRQVYCSPNRIYLYCLETGERRPLTEPPRSSQGDFRPAFSPDGGAIAFVRGDRMWLEDIFIMPSQGGEPRRLTSSHRKISGLDWMPDGKSLIFSAGPSGAGDLRLWRLSIEDGSLAWLPTAGNRPARPSVAAGGSRLVYENQAIECNIEKIGVGGGGASAPVVTSTRVDYGPQYSPGGNYMSFISNRTGSPQIWVCDGLGDDLRQLTDFEDAYIENPCWSFDERRVAFTAAPGTYTAIYVAEIETGEVNRLSASDSHEMCLGWSRDGDWLYCKSERDDAWWVYKISVGGDEVIEIMEKNVYRLAESIGGDRLIYSRADTSGVWSSSLTGSDEVCLIDEPGRVVPCGWRETGAGVYYFSVCEDSVCLWLMDGDGGEPVLLAREADFRAVDIDISPAGDAVIFDRLKHTGSDLVIVENVH